jgi:hypothetical protein
LEEQIITMAKLKMTKRKLNTTQKAKDLVTRTPPPPQKKPTGMNSGAPERKVIPVR